MLPTVTQPCPEREGLTAHHARVADVARAVAGAAARAAARHRVCAPEHAVWVRVACLYDRAVLPRWHQDDRGERNAHRGVHSLAPAGAYRGIRVWDGRQHWLAFVIPLAIARHRALLAREQLSAATFKLWARVESGYVQDQRTGRRCIVRPATVASVMAVTPNTVRKCRRVARAMGVQVVVQLGRMLTVDECFAARRRGSRQRGLSTECALTIPAWYSRHVALSTGDGGRGPREAGSSTPDLFSAGTSVTPTRGRARRHETHQDLHPLDALTGEKTEAAAPPASTRGVPPAARPPRRGAGGRPHRPTTAPTARQSAVPVLDDLREVLHDVQDAPRSSQTRQRGRGPHSPAPRHATPAQARSARQAREVRRVAHELRRLLPWLREEQPGRLAPALTRFTNPTHSPSSMTAAAAAERVVRPGLAWTAQDLAQAITDLRARHGHTTPLRPETIHTRPAVVLAAWLRELDPISDHPRLPTLDPAQLRCGRPECDHGWVTVLIPRPAPHQHLLAEAVTRCPHCIPGAWPTRTPADAHQVEELDELEVWEAGDVDEEPPF